MDGDYKQELFYFRHLGWVVQAVVLALNEFVPITIGRSVAISLVLLALLVLLIILRPFATKSR